ncbi:MAG: hypothetical protein ACRDYC_10900, partial [Acidimicrobiales bacterium]
MATKIYYCSNCGYEVKSGGRCHLCKQKLVTSPLPELAETDDEVGYRLEHWSDRGRGMLIEALINAGIRHRFEEDELVVDASDEEATDELVDEVAEEASNLPVYDDEELEEDEEVFLPGSLDPVLVGQIELLHRAARRLVLDPTDMQADGDVAEASTAVFLVDQVPGIDVATWSAVGRVTRRLLAALASEQALEEEIRIQAGTLAKLLDGYLPALEEEGPQTKDDRTESVDETDADGDDEPEEGEEGEEDEDERGETVYELPDWLPEQRARLSVLLDGAGIPHSWEHGDLVVAADRESEAEALFDGIVDASDMDDPDGDDEARYRSLEELFAAADRLVND